MDNSFESLPLKPQILKGLNDLGFTSMTPIQAECLLRILAGDNIIAQAKTGSGKTAAFGLGIVNSLDTTNLDVHSLVLCPTRELAEQVATHLRDLARSLQNIKILTLCGGIPESIQRKSLLSGAHIVVGTPGRVLSLLEKNALKLDVIKNFTLDEADKMLDMGFHDSILDIETYLPKRRQTLLFSATYPTEIKTLSEKIQPNAFEVKIDTIHEVHTINQTFYEVPADQDKNAVLYNLLAKHRLDRVLIFCTTKKESNDVARFLKQRGVYAKSLNGSLDQNERTKVLTQFSNRSLSVLVATDVAARGLDIHELGAVINYSLPPNAECYTHRIGRTGRAGSIGLAFSLFYPAESFRLDNITTYTKQEISVEKYSQPSCLQKYDLVPPMKTLYISGGKKDKLRPGDIVGALVGEAKLDANDIGDICILNILSYVAIKKEHADKTIKKMKVGTIKKRKYKIDFA